MSKTIYITTDGQNINVEAEKNNGYGVKILLDRSLIDRLEDIIERSKSLEEIKEETEQYRQEELEQKEEQLNLALIVLAANLNDKEKVKFKAVFPLYKHGETYSKDMAVPYIVYPDYESGKLYQVVENDEFVGSAEIKPNTSNLFKEVKGQEIYPMWTKKIWYKGQKCNYVGRGWECIATSSVYSPIDYPKHWKDLGEYDEN